MTTFAPGVYDIPEDEYFAQPGLSASGMKQLLDSPAKFYWLQSNPQPHKDVFDFGSAAHRLVLGAGPDLEVVEFDNWMTKAAKEARTAARDEGKTPILAKDYKIVQAMADTLSEHTHAMELLDPDLGKPEQSVFWEHHGIPCRARFDWLPDAVSGHMVIPDYKTAATADREGFAKAAANFGYHIQDRFYARGAVAVGLAESAKVRFIVQEKEAPYLVNVIELDSEFDRIADQLIDQAFGLFQQCMEHNEWPGYGDLCSIVTPPRWYVSQHDWKNR